MSKSYNSGLATTKRDGYEPTYSMQIPKIDNADNFRIDKIIEEYKSKINSIAKIIIPERKQAQNKNEFNIKNPEILAKLKFKKENKQNLLKINDAIVGKILTSQPTDPKEHKNMIKRLAKGDTKLMLGIPQLRSKDGLLLNSPLNKLKLEKYKNESIVELKKIDDSYENKITDKDFVNNLNNINNKNNNKDYNVKESMAKTKKSNLSKNKDAGFFLTGVAGQHEKKVDFFLGENKKDLDSIENNLNANYNRKNEIKSNTDFSTKSIRQIKKESNKSIYNSLKEKANLQSNKHNNKTNIEKLALDNENFDKDSDLFSDENRYISITKKGKNRVKSLQSVNRAWNTQENYNGSLPQLNNYNNYYKTNLDSLSKMKSKEADFFKMSLRTKSLKNLKNQKTAKKEKRFLKTNYLSAMNDFLSTVNTEMDFYMNTFTDIERGMKNYDHIQSVHWDIQPDKLLDKKMIYQDEQFVRKYFIYGTQGGQFISEDKANDDIIERSDNLAKITPEISYKFKNMILDRFAEKPLVDFGQFLERNEYNQKRFKENTIKVAKLIDDTDKRKARIEKDLNRFFLKAKE